MKIIKYTLSIVLCLCFAFCVGCTNKTDTTSTENVKISETKDYYKNLGYVDVNASDCFQISGDDVVRFNDGTMKVKLKSTISITFSKSNFKYICQYFVDFDSLRLLSGININDTPYSIYDFDLQNYKVTSSVTINPIYSDFKLNGVAIVVDENPNTEILNLHSDDLFNERSLLFINSLSGNLRNDILNNNLDYNVEFTSNLSDSIEFEVELFTNGFNYHVYAIIKTETNEYFLIEMERNNEKFSLNKNGDFNVTVQISEM